MDRSENLYHVTAYLSDCFAGGQRMVSRHDVIDDEGTTIHQAISAALRDLREPHELLEALSAISDAWAQGFDLASCDDLVTGGETVADIVLDFLSSQPTTDAQPSP